MNITRRFCVFTLSEQHAQMTVVRAANSNPEQQTFIEFAVSMLQSFTDSMYSFTVNDMYGNEIIPVQGRCAAALLRVL
jgi:hypothetical protein